MPSTFFKGFFQLRQCDMGFFIWCRCKGGAGDEGERRKMEFLENRNWKQIKARLNMEATVVWMPQGFQKPPVLGGGCIGSGGSTNSALSYQLPKEGSAHHSKWRPPSACECREEGGGRRQNLWARTWEGQRPFSYCLQNCFHSFSLSWVMNPQT